MRRGCANRERGAALLVLLAVISLAASWFLVRQLNAESGGIDAARKNRNAEVLNRAKQALIGYVAQNAATAGEDNPGAFPCPEYPSGFYSTSGTDGKTQTPSCSLPAVGRFPWRTIGTDKLVDASGEPLWYVLASGWSKPGATGNTIINSNCTDATSAMDCWTGQLTVDGQANAAVALIIAPGPAITKVAGAGCTAGNQVRPVGLDPDLCDYLEGENATKPANATFVTTGPSSSFNDQVIRITVADIMPAIEAAIAQRVEREIAPLMQTIYAAPNWGLSGTERKYPFAVGPFADPSTSAMQGTAATLQGLLPMVNAETYPGSGVLCTAGPSVPRCAPDFVRWASANMASSASTFSESCVVTPTQATCTFYYRCLLFACFTSSIPFTINATADYVGMAMRQLNPGLAIPGVTSITSLSALLNANGSATMAFSGTVTGSAGAGWVVDALCGLGFPLTMFLGCKQYSVSVPVNIFADHPLLDTRSTGASTSWFARNGWHELTYYALAAGYAPSGSAACTTGSTCLSVANVTPSGAQRAILILAGRSINGSSRPSATLGDYLELGNATAAYERKTVSAGMVVPAAQRFNDRIVVIDAN